MNKSQADEFISKAKELDGKISVVLNELRDQKITQVQAMAHIKGLSTQQHLLNTLIQLDGVKIAIEHSIREQSQENGSGKYQKVNYARR